VNRESSLHIAQGFARHFGVREMKLQKSTAHCYSKQIINSIIPAFALFSIACLWEGAVNVTGYPEYLLPAPSAILYRVLSDWPILVKHSMVTLTEIAIGFLVGGFCGVLLAVLITHNRFAERVVMPLALLLQTTPKLAIAPLFLIWFGYGMLPKVIMTILMCVFPVLINTAAGLRSVDSRIIELLSILKATRWQILTKVRFPTALPHFFVGLKISITLAVIGAIVGEWVGASAGLGHLILAANSQLDTVLVFAAVTAITLLGMVMYFVVYIVEHWCIHWQDSIDASGQV
jgi:ABC-type nitrate/sulfonate/bicarbonate transport system permease component